MKYSTYSFLTSALDGVSSQRHAQKNKINVGTYSKHQALETCMGGKYVCILYVDITSMEMSYHIHSRLSLRPGKEPPPTGTYPLCRQWNRYWNGNHGYILPTLFPGFKPLPLTPQPMKKLNLFHAYHCEHTCIETLRPCSDSSVNPPLLISKSFAILQRL
jgi:hypothetical protein